MKVCRMFEVSQLVLCGVFCKPADGRICILIEECWIRVEPCRMSGMPWKVLKHTRMCTVWRMNESMASCSRIILLVGESLVLKNLENSVGSSSRMKFLEVLCIFPRLWNVSALSRSFLKWMNWRSNLFLTVRINRIECYTKNY